MYLVKKRGEFSAAHRHFCPELSEEENRKIFGSCYSPNYHGHNYRVEVTVASEELEARTGMVVDFRELEKLINSEIIDKADHRNLNLDVDFLQGINPTAENLARKFFELLEGKIPRGKLVAVSVSESEDDAAIYFRNKEFAGSVF